ncbi:MAG TPA: hypothetical protein VFG76_09150 [Candidatus Polarisedimenticolia bacterium]|nr:hypothetical protein [Candidatus Polarisedimenticolia bacterium]
MADLIEGALPRGVLDGVERHLLGCAGCRDARDASVRVMQHVKDAGRVPVVSTAPGPAALDDFETRLMREIRARVSRPEPYREASIGWSQRPAAVAAAMVLMLGAGLAALYLGGYVTKMSPGGFTPRLQATLGDGTAGSDPGAVDEAVDDLATEEIPFLVHRDLVGPVRGRFPATTYVLEPAPDESDVRRASF